jgi:transcriptional regulator with XRE-family HTH domain
MILADKIIELRKKNGWSQEELADKLGVSRQAVSKWESAQAVPDMNRIIRLSEIFGVSTDLLLKDELELSTAVPAELAESGLDGSARSVSMEEASAFLEHRERSSLRVALGVMMCILSPILLIVLSSAQEHGLIALSEQQVTGIGLAAMLLLIGGAVALFIVQGLRASKFEYLSKECIETRYGVDGIVRDRREKFRHSFNTHIALGVVLCVAAALPLFIAMFFFGGEDKSANEFPYAVAAACLLLLVALGVYLIVRASIVWGSFQILLEDGDYTRQKKAEDKKNDTLSSIYWCSVTAIFLAYSFITGRWHRSWIIWPVAGVAFGVVIAVANALRKRG